MAAPMNKVPGPMDTFKLPKDMKIKTVNIIAPSTVKVKGIIPTDEQNEYSYTAYAENTHPEYLMGLYETCEIRGIPITPNIKLEPEVGSPLLVLRTRSRNCRNYRRR